ncbi:hypothetical protein GS473_13750 [Rhodococcus hoagii]|nr:hypothetical protein [Prescottella equi]
MGSISILGELVDVLGELMAIMVARDQRHRWRGGGGLGAGSPRQLTARRHPRSPSPRRRAFGAGVTTSGAG